MIEATNVDVVNHKADFRCRLHDAYATGLDLLKQTRWARGQHRTPVFIRVRGASLHEGKEARCLCITLFFVPGKTEIERALALAKRTDEDFFFEEDDAAEKKPVTVISEEVEPVNTEADAEEICDRSENSREPEMREPRAQQIFSDVEQEAKEILSAWS